MMLINIQNLKFYNVNKPELTFINVIQELVQSMVQVPTLIIPDS